MAKEGITLRLAVVAPKNFSEVVREAFAVRFEDALNDMRARSPIGDTGLYAGSWLLDRVDEYGVTIVNDAPYASWVRRTGAKTTLIPEIYRRANRAANEVIEDLADELPTALLGELHRQTER